MATIDAFRAAATTLDVYACGGDVGRDKRDPVYQHVTEGRDSPSAYATFSSCAERAHWKLYRLGCRASWINRKQHKGWTVGVNISKLAYGPAFSRQPNRDWAPSPGDELLIWNKSDGTDAHSLSIVEFADGHAKTANYGASGMSTRTFPGAKLGTAPLVFNGALWKYGAPGHTKTVYRVLRLEDLIPTFTDAPDLTYIDGDLLPEMSRAYDEIVTARGQA
jgi:hypothetical protein